MKTHVLAEEDESSVLKTLGGVIGLICFFIFSSSGVAGGVPSYIGLSTADCEDFKERFSLFLGDFPSLPEIFAGRVANLDSLGFFSVRGFSEVESRTESSMDFPPALLSSSLESPNGLRASEVPVVIGGGSSKGFLAF